MLYHFYEWNHAALTPFRMVADAARLFYRSPLNPLSRTTAGRSMAAAAELFERSTRIYAKPEFGLHETSVRGMRVPVQDRVVWEKPFGRLLFFDRAVPKSHRKDPRFLVVAPLSGHHATLLRGTVEALLPDADVYITDWTDARDVPVAAGKFDLEDYTDYLIEMLHFLGPDTHVIGVCQPAVPVLMAVARMEEDGDDCAPATMTLMGGPIDTRINPTEVNELAESKGIDWFAENVVMPVPFPHAGMGRMVYPGFLQLTGFKSMNLDRHMIADKDFFWDLVKNDGDSAERHRQFYDEYNAVLDLTAEFYLQTVDEVFVKHSLPKGEMMLHGRPIDLKKIRRTALLTVEGENDDISGVGQTEAAQHLCSNIPTDMRVHYVQPKVGHYGVFNGSRFRAEICPRIVDFALTHGTTHSAAKLPKTERPAPGTTTFQRTGAVAERDAKAGTLGRGRQAAGETVLAGAVVPDAAGAFRAMTAPAEAMMSAAFGKAKPLGAKLPENPADERAGAAATLSKANAAPAPASAPVAVEPTGDVLAARAVTKSVAEQAASTAPAKNPPAKATAMRPGRTATIEKPAATGLASQQATSAIAAQTARPQAAAPKAGGSSRRGPVAPAASPIAKSAPVTGDKPVADKSAGKPVTSRSIEKTPVPAAKSPAPSTPAKSVGRTAETTKAATTVAVPVKAASAPTVTKAVPEATPATARSSGATAPRKVRAGTAMAAVTPALAPSGARAAPEPASSGDRTRASDAASAAGEAGPALVSARQTDKASLATTVTTVPEAAKATTPASASVPEAIKRATDAAPLPAPAAPDKAAEQPRGRPNRQSRRAQRAAKPHGRKR